MILEITAQSAQEYFSYKYSVAFLSFALSPAMICS